MTIRYIRLRESHHGRLVYRNISVSLLAAALSAIVLVIVPGCEESVSGTDIVLPFEEELVVQGLLTADDVDDTIHIARTLHPLKKYSIEEAAVTDADATITGNGKEYGLVHIRNGLYYIDGLRATPGSSYTLRVRWKGLKVEATAAVPQPIEIVRVFRDTIKNGCEYYTYPEHNKEYSDAIRTRIEYIRDGNTLHNTRIDVASYIKETGRTLYRTQNYYRRFFDVDSTGTTNVASLEEECGFYQVPNQTRVDTLFIDIVKTEEAFTAYYDSRFNNDDNIFFGPGSEQPAWNVRGDGFGWFFGASRSRDTAVLQ